MKYQIVQKGYKGIKKLQQILDITSEIKNRIKDTNNFNSVSFPQTLLISFSSITQRFKPNTFKSYNRPMHKLHQKEIQKLKQQHKVKQQQYKTLLAQMITSQQQLKQAILFTKDIFEFILSKQPDQSQPPPFYLSDFTPSSISKLVFEEHLTKIKHQFDQLPNSQAKLENFILIMIKVLFVDQTRLIKKQQQQQIIKTIIKQQTSKNPTIRINSPNKNPNSPKKIKPPANLIKREKLHTIKPPSFLQQKPELPSSHFDKYPFYIIALLYMFKQILPTSQTTITFHQLQKFIMGELVTNSKPNSNTEFTIQFEETKKQDFLLHDNGIRRLVYCQGMNVYLCLDVKQQMIKIYTAELKNKQNFQPNRQKHNRKAPEIIDMFYSDFGNTLGLVLADKTIEIVNFEAFMTKLYEKEFLPLIMHQIVIRFESPLKRIFFLQMFNKWLTVGIKNQLLLVDVSKYRSKDEEITIIPVKNEKLQLNISQILQIIPLSTICVVAGNELWFYDEKMGKKRYNSYVHEINISVVKYYEEKNAFYISGDKEKCLTILKPQRGRQYMEITTVTYSRPIIDFELFSIFGSILLVDDKHTVRLVSEQTKHMYQAQDYGRIVKEGNNEDQQNGKKITILKINRQQFIIHESYMVSMGLAKVPVQTQIDFDFLPHHYFDPLKEDFHLCFNNQILCISLLEGELRHSYTPDNSNLSPPAYFLQASHKWAPFVLDQEGKVYDLCLKDVETASENDIKKYKRKLDVKDLRWATFDEELGRLILLSPQQLYQVKNQTKNTFSTVNVTTFSNFQVLSSTYLKSRKSLLLNCLSSSNPSLQSPTLSQSNLLNTSSSTLLNISKKSFSLQQQFKPIPQQQFCLLMSVNHPTQYRVIKFNFEKIKQDDKPEVILRCLIVEDYDIAVILTDENVVYLTDVKANTVRQKRQTTEENNYEVSEEHTPSKQGNFICLKVYHFIAPKVRDLLRFNQVYVNNLKVSTTHKSTSSINASKRQNLNNALSSQYTSIFLTSEQGFFIEINLDRILNKHFPKTSILKQVERHSIAALSELCEIDYGNFKHQDIEQIQLSKRDSYNFEKLEEEFCLVKAHNACKIELIQKIQLEFLLTITVGRDGFLKLWNNFKECIVSLKLPTLRKDVFDIRKIQDIRGRRMMEQAQLVVKKITQHINDKQNLQQILTLTRQHQLEKTYQRINEQQPIKIQIQNKSIQEIVVEEPYYHTLGNPSAKQLRQRYGDQGETETANKSQAMSLKKQRSFENILDKSRLNQANWPESLTIPVQLLALRKPLKKYERKKQSMSINLTGVHETGPKRQELLILPKLKQYKMQSRQSRHPTIWTERHTSNIKQQLDSEDGEYDKFEPCAFVKNKIERKKGNALDRIDKEFIRKEHSLLVKKHLARKKDSVRISNNKGPIEEREDMDESGNAGVSLETIVNDIRRIRYQSKFGGDRFIPKVRFKSYSQLD